MAALSGLHREVVLMRFVDDMSLQEIAEALDVPLGTVKSRLHHAIEALRNDPRAQEFFSAVNLSVGYGHFRRWSPVR
jgi:RNA polymerase sigma-70 factor (ECF subfamily)